MEHSKAVEKIEKLLSDAGIPLLSIEGRIVRSPDIDRLPKGEYFIADIRIAISISPST